MALEGVPDGVFWPKGWPAPNYIDPVTRGSPVFFVVTAAVTTVVVALRLYSRFCLTRSPGIDDAFIMAGFILSIGLSYVEYKNITVWGWNKHLWDVTFLEHPKVRLGAWLLQFFFITSTSCTKVSILFVFRRISSGSNSIWFVRLVWVAIAFTIIYTTALVLELFLICDPYVSYWKAYDITYAHKFHCGNERVPIILSVCLNFVSDIYATVLPMFLVRNLKLSRKQRIGLTVLFSVGILTIGTGAVRIYYINKVTSHYKPGPDTHDVTWIGWPMYVWTDIEAHLAIICASAPALKVVFMKKLKEPLTSVFASSRQQLSRYHSLRSKSTTSHHSQPSKSGMNENGSGGRRLHNLVRHSNQHFEIVHVHPRHISAHMATVQEQFERDVEKDPSEKVIGIDKKPACVSSAILGKSRKSWQGLVYADGKCKGIQ